MEFCMPTSRRVHAPPQHLGWTRSAKSQYSGHRMVSAHTGSDMRYAGLAQRQTQCSSTCNAASCSRQKRASVTVWAWRYEDLEHRVGEEIAASADINNLKDVHASEGRGAHETDEAKHSHAAVGNLSGGGEAKLHGREETIGLLILLTIEKGERITEHLRAEGRSEGYS
mmetsp:Transcript_6921/g.21100  ORF Transcript_6921/g.21100 Transcript_6921/m.21100 type:complete len:169 (-) Transcript_6921:403-909(-)